jgi:hypothetical protein
VGKGKKVDVYLEVRKRRGHIFFEWFFFTRCIALLVYLITFELLKQTTINQKTK